MTDVHQQADARMDSNPKSRDCFNLLIRSNIAVALNAKVPLFGSERKTSIVNCVTMHHQLTGIEVNSCTHQSKRWHSDIQTQSTQRNFLAYLEGTLYSWISLLEKRRDLMPTPWGWEGSKLETHVAGYSMVKPKWILQLGMWEMFHIVDSTWP